MSTCRSRLPAPGQVLVKTRVRRRVQGRLAGADRPSQWLTSPFPVTVGYEMAGVIEALGPGVTGFAVGQPVHVLHMAVYGTNADYMAVTADDVAPLPEGMDFDAAAAAFNYFVAWGLLNQIVQAHRRPDALHRRGGRRHRHRGHPVGAAPGG